MDVHGVREPQLVPGLDERGDHPARGEVEGPDLVVEAGDVGVALALPHLVPPGIHELRGIRLGHLQPPGERVPELLAPSLLEQPVEQQVVAHQHEKALVEDGRVVEFLQRVPRSERRHGRFHGGRVAERRIAIARRERGGNRAAGARSGEPGAELHVVLVGLGLHLAGEVDLRAGDVAVDVDAARHHHHAGRVDALRVGWHVGHDLPVADAHILHRAVDAVGGVVYPTVDDAQRRSHGIPPGTPGSTRRRRPGRPPAAGFLPAARVPGREWRSAPPRRSGTGTRRRDAA